MEQVGLYQIVRESLNQAVRRGPPSKISVAIRDTAEGEIETVVSDNGTGERRTASLDAIGERASTLNGRFSVEQGSDGGTSIHVVLPPTPATPSNYNPPPMAEENGHHGAAGYVLFVWSPAGWTLQQRDGDAPAVGETVEAGDTMLRVEQARPLAAARRPPPLRLHAACLAQDEHPLSRIPIARRPLKGPLRGPRARHSRLLAQGGLGGDAAEDERGGEAAAVAAGEDAARVGARGRAGPGRAGRPSSSTRARSSMRRPPIVCVTAAWTRIATNGALDELG